MALPRYVVLKATINNKYLRYLYENGESHGSFTSSGDEIYDLSAKFALEEAQSVKGLIHIRCCYNNKYMVWSPERYLMLPTADQPHEDQSASTCTLFNPVFKDVSANTLRIRHIQSRCWASLRYSITPGVGYILGGDVAMDATHSSDVFTLFDWDKLLIMPKYVAFKGYNDKYLKAGWIEGHEYLQFSGDDKGDLATGYEVTMNPEGFVRIKSRYFNDKFWRLSPNWIWADTTDTTSNNSDTLFWPVKVNDTTVALRNEGNKNFCKSLTTEGKTNCLNAADSTITKYTHLQVEELVLEREIYNVRYRMDDARIYNENPFIAGTGVATNDSQQAGTYSISVSYEDSKSYSWNNTISLTLGISNTFEAGIPFIVDSKIEVSAQFQDSYQWGKTNTQNKKAEATYQAVVPAMSKVKVNYVATIGTCDVPFSYTQRDKLSIDGSYIITEKHDGLYTGVNYYSFHFDQVATETL